MWLEKSITVPRDWRWNCFYPGRGLTVVLSADKLCVCACTRTCTCIYVHVYDVYKLIQEMSSRLVWKRVTHASCSYAPSHEALTPDSRRLSSDLWGRYVTLHVSTNCWLSPGKGKLWKNISHAAGQDGGATSQEQISIQHPPFEIPG